MEKKFIKSNQRGNPWLLVGIFTVLLILPSLLIPVIGILGYSISRQPEYLLSVFIIFGFLSFVFNRKNLQKNLIFLLITFIYILIPFLIVNYSYIQNTGHDLSYCDWGGCNNYKPNNLVYKIENYLFIPLPYWISTTFSLITYWLYLNKGNKSSEDGHLKDISELDPY